MSVNICGVLLAAGRSTRFGSQKLLHPLHDGELIGIASAKHLLQAVPNSIAVVSNDKDELAKHLTALGYILIVNEKNSGMGSSIACGIEHTQADAWIITLADMPYIHCETIQQVVRLMQSGKGIVAPNCQGRAGHPVGFSQNYREDLLALNADRGAKSIIKKYQQDIVLFDTDDAGCLRDIDRREDL